MAPGPSGVFSFSMTAADFSPPTSAAVRAPLGVLALVATTLIWGTTFPSMKMLEGDLAALHIAVLRSGLAALLLLPLAVRTRRDEWRWGLMLGVLSFVAFWLQVEGLMRTSSNRNAFLTGLNVLIVPLLAWATFRQCPGWKLWLACALALCGMGLMFYEGAPWSAGDSLTLLSALCYAVYVLMLDVCARRNAAAPLRPVHLVMALSVGMALSAAVALSVQGATGGEGWALLVERVRHLRPVAVWAMVYLVVVASVLAIVLQAWGQQRVDATRSAIIYGLEPVFAACAAWVLIGETLAASALAGAALIVTATVLGQWPTRSSRSSPDDGPPAAA